LSIEEQEKAFLATPNGVALIALYKALQADFKDDLLAGILDRIRPIQHRITLIQADASPNILEALARDPHQDVRRVVASHGAITDEVCFRLGEDQNQGVRLTLRKNPNCHPLVRAALLAREENNETINELLLEMSWQARRCELKPEETIELIEEWTGVVEEQLPNLAVEQAHLVLDVLAAKLGQGTMPRKPRRARGR
jgi:hypothetical protein